MKRSEVIKRLIDKKGMTIKAFSEHIGIPYTTLYSILERGVGRASIDNVLKICRSLGITAEELERMAIEGNSEPEPETPDLSEVEILTLAAHSTGHVGKLTDDQLAKIKLAVKIALAKDNN